MKKPKLLDLFCGAGGASMGYHRAGFDVTGVDIEPQKNYPFEFFQSDALAYLDRNAHLYDAFAAGYSRMRHLPWLKHKIYPLLIGPTRALLETTGKPWVIENVEGAPLSGITLCGTMFGLKVYRHRLFESNYLLLQPEHIPHTVVIGSGRNLNDRAIGVNADGWVSTLRSSGKGTRINGLRGNPDIRTIAGHFSGMETAKAAMGIDWMNRDELSQAVPPAYTQFIGEQLMQHLGYLIRELAVA